MKLKRVLIQIMRNSQVQPAGSVAFSCNHATGRPGEADDLRSGQLLDGHLDVNLDYLKGRFTSLSK